MASRVLVADDSAVVRVTLARRLRAEGRDVLESDSAAAAITVDGATLACALLDLDLGDGWGTDVAERLRGIRPELPVAFFTSESGGSDVVARARTFGPVFAKPDELDRAIAWALAF